MNSHTNHPKGPKDWSKPPFKKTPVIQGKALKLERRAPTPVAPPPQVPEPPVDTRIKVPLGRAW